MEYKYKKLDGLIYAKGLKKRAVAESLGMSPKSLSNKIKGVTPFTWEEAKTLRDVFFPNETIDDLFATDEPEII